jgi:hypothetical protein
LHRPTLAKIDPFAKLPLPESLVNYTTRIPEEPEKGTFSWPAPTDPQVVKLRLAPEALAMLTDGIDLRGARLRPWYERESQT